MNFALKFAALGLLLPAGAGTVLAQQDYFSNWPAGSSPQEVGRSLAEHFITSPHQSSTIFYGECAIGSYNALRILAPLSTFGRRLDMCTL